MLLSVKALSAWYGEAQALWSIDLHVAHGEVVGVLGRNGAGKTTLLRSITGLQSKVSGEVLLEGKSIAGVAPHRISLRGLSLLREGGRMATSLTVAQHLELGRRLGGLRGGAPRPLAEIWRWFPMLEPLRDRAAGMLSGGQRQALALAAALVANPKLLLLDEPSAGLAPQVAHELFRTIRKLAEQGLSVLVVEQQPAWLDGLAKRNYLLEVGNVIAAGDLTDLMSQQSASQ
jgi:branched-chain amino acid transport system ATP-binding protein